MSGFNMYTKKTDVYVDVSSRSVVSTCTIADNVQSVVMLHVVGSMRWLGCATTPFERLDGFSAIRFDAVGRNGRRLGLGAVTAGLD
jgi:hypothetical protein